MGRCTDLPISIAPAFSVASRDPLYRTSAGRSPFPKSWLRGKDPILLGISNLRPRREGLGFASTCLRNSRRLRDAEVLPVPTTSQPPREKVEKRPDEVKRPSARQLGISTDSRSEPKN